MRKSLQLLGCLAILAAPLLVLPAHAQSQNNAAPAPNAGNAGAPPQGEWRSDREEMDQLRAEHDRLKMQCLDAKGQDATECQQKMKALHDRRMALRQKMHAMHAQNASAHGQQPGQHQGQWQQHQDQTNGASNNPNPPTNPPPAPSQTP